MSEFDIYQADFLKTLFDEMQTTYERVSTLTSFGFNRRWRRQLVNHMYLQSGMRIGDLMAGGGESWVYILPRIGEAGSLTAVDFSRSMIQQAYQRQQTLPTQNVHVLHEDALCSSIPSGSLEAIVCFYGVKTLSDEQYRLFVHEIRRILKAGGSFGLVEVSVPTFMLLRLPYMFYMKQIVPLIGKLLLGNPDNYRMLGVYMERFKNCQRLGRLFGESGFDVRYQCFFWGCATALVGKLNSRE
jgi:demethylmenaquinone methyltransferase/2-methoxy-6-polyprenyl-1,4-benzoquinol methylase